MHAFEPADGFYLKDRAALMEATELMTMFGTWAEGEAAARADRSRATGNLAKYCHWRQIERAIVALSVEDVTGTVH